jgi:hypothetical protein
MHLAPPFSRRHGFNPAKAITVREGAPENLRSFVLQTARGRWPRPGPFRRLVCRVLHVTPNEENYRDEHIWKEVRVLMNTCPWYKVYDIIEALLHGSVIWRRGVEGIGGWTRS